MEESKQHVLFIKKSFDFICFSLEKTNVKKNYTKISSLKGFSAFFRSSFPDVFCGKGVPKNFTKFLGKHLCQSLFFKPLRGAMQGESDKQATFEKVKTFVQALYDYNFITLWEQLL